MDNLDLISNDELRSRLVQYGFQNLPVTQTTRKVLIKKLRMYMEGEKNKVRRQTTNVTKYSSEEESSDREKPQTTARRGRTSIASTGITTNLTMPPPATSSTVGNTATSRRSINSGSQLKNNYPHHHHHHHQQQQQQQRQQQESDEDSSSSDTGNNNYSAGSLNSSFNNNYGSGSISASSTRLSTGGYAATPSPIRGGETNTYGDYNRPISGRVSIGAGPRTSPAYQSNVSPTNLYNRSLNSYQHYYGSGTTGDHPKASSASSVPLVADASNGHSAENSPYLSDFTKRLLNLRGTTVPESNSHRPEVFRPITTKLGLTNQRYLSDAGANPLPSDYFNINQNSGGGGGIVHTPRPRLSISTTTPSPLSSSRSRQQYLPTAQSTNSNKISGNSSISKKISNFLIKLDDQYGGVKQTFVPRCLLSVLMVFLAVVVIMYLTINPDIASTVNRVDTEFTLCGPGFIQDDSNLITCIYEDHLSPALDLLKTTAKELQRRIEANRCTDSTIPFSMSSNEVIKLAIAKNPERNIAATMEHLRGMEYLIHMNPKWRIQQCDIAGNTLNFDEIRNVGFDKYFAIINPRLPFTCSLYNKLQRFFITVGTIALIVLAGFIFYYGYWMLRAWRQNRRDKVNTLIADIIQALMEKSSDAMEDSTQSSAVVVNHLKNQLIPLAERSQMDWVWKEAIDFLERNEGRIQFEIGNRSGEDFQMMRWIDTVAPSSPTRGASSSVGNISGGGGAGGGGLNNRQSSRTPSTVKKWQSPAFDKTNKIKDPPTECLKIRQMFDKYEATNPKLKQIIQDSILEKTGPNCKIYDIQLESSSCCVYVRCATSADAGIVHEQINGWWFDSRLVSIKFLRLDRYLTRFPQSLAGPKLLRPSNTKNLSMSNCDNDDQSSGAVAAAAASRRNGSKQQIQTRNSNDGENDNDDYEDDDDGNNEY